MIERAPRHVPGLAFERAFALAVFEDADRPSLHEALVFCTEDWAAEWRRRGWDTSRGTQRRLLAVHRSAWRFAPADALALICP